MFANHINRLKQNPSYNKSSQLYTRQETLQSPAWGVIRSRVAGEKNLGLEVKKQTPGDPLAPILGLELPRVLPILTEHPAIEAYLQLPQFAKLAARCCRVSMYKKKSMTQTCRGTCPSYGAWGRQEHQEPSQVRITGRYVDSRLVLS